MAQRNDMAEKKKVYWEGATPSEVVGLVSVSEIPLERAAIDVPEFGAIRRVQSGITRMPDVTFVYKIQKASATLAFFQSFYLQSLTKTVTVARTDASGAEFARTQLQDCECVYMSEPDFDAGNPTFAKVTIRVIPYDIRFLSAENV